MIGGQDVWTQRWRRGEPAPVRLPHPAYPDQIHDFDRYLIGDPAHPVRFVAAEVSNGVWAFYVPADYSVDPQARGAAGPLLYEHRDGPFLNGRYDSLAPAAVLIDAASDRVLLDCSGWASSRITPQEDGSLVLVLAQNHWSWMFRIDPWAGTFRDLVDGGGDRPLADIRGAVGEAWQASGRRDPANRERRIAPDGCAVVDLEAVEWFNTHFVVSPRVTDVSRGRVVLDLWTTDWGAVVSFPRPGCVRLGLRRYRGGGHLGAELDLGSGRYRIDAGPNSEAALAEGPLADVARALEDEFARGVAAMGPPAAGVARQRTSARRRTPVRPGGPGQSVAWRATILILAAAAVAIAVGTVVTEELSPAPALTPLPPPPHLSQ
ncbi:MAG: hypothetical protein KDA49_15955 [Rhodospirillaceae bacterium]|nr:hypothetical protein [Rhodospirillaceae bacterium]